MEKLEPKTAFNTFTQPGLAGVTFQCLNLVLSREILALLVI